MAFFYAVGVQPRRKGLRGLPDVSVRKRMTPETIVVYKEVTGRVGHVPKEIDERLAPHGEIMM